MEVFYETDFGFDFSCSTAVGANGLCSFRLPGDGETVGRRDGGTARDSGALHVADLEERRKTGDAGRMGLFSGIL